MSAATRERVLSLDAFRGITIAAMILVNNPGASPVYRQLDHAPWNGWTFTDTIFPFFLWIVGVAITLSTARRVEQGKTPRELAIHAFRRALILYLFGFFLAGFPDFHLAHIRYLGVLQRISICYLAAALLFLFRRWPVQLATIFALYLIYGLLMLFYPVPGVGAGHLEESGNFARYIDGLLLRGHMWSHTRYWDPEGIVSTLPAIATTIWGLFAGQLLRLNRTVQQRAAYILLPACGLLVLGKIVAIWMPINKNLWSVSFSLWMAGLAAVEFTVLYLLMDWKGWRAWARPFIIYGSNAIAVFVLSGAIGRLLMLIKVHSTGPQPQSLGAWLYAVCFEPFASVRNASLLYALANVAVLYLIAWLLWRQRWFLRV